MTSINNIYGFDVIGFFALSAVTPKPPKRCKYVIPMNEFILFIY